jgi:Tfp pilus assembly protein PilX
MYSQRNLFIFGLLIVLVSSGFAQESERQKRIEALKREKEALLNEAEADKKKLRSAEFDRQNVDKRAQDKANQTDKEKQLFGNPNSVEKDAIAKANEFIGQKMATCSDGQSYMLLRINPSVNRSLNYYVLTGMPTFGVRSVITGQGTSQGDWSGVLKITSPTVKVIAWTKPASSVKKMDEKDWEIEFYMKRSGASFNSGGLAEGRWNIAVKVDGKAWLTRDTIIENAGNCDEIMRSLAGPTSKTIR